MMNRTYNVSDFLFVAIKLKNEIPNITIATDVIIGFPGETEKEFDDTYKLIQEIKPAVLNISRFWPKKNTSASKLNQVDLIEVKTRSARMHNLFQEISKENLKKFVDCEYFIYVDEVVDNGYSGRTEFYIPVFVRSKCDLMGQIVNVKIVSSSAHCLIGRIIEDHECL